MANKYATPIVLSDDNLTHVPGRSGQPLDPESIPLAPGADNLLDKTPDGLVLRAEDLISAEKNNPLAVGADQKLKVVMGTVVPSNDPILTVQDNQLKTTFSMSLGSDGVLVFKGANGQTLDSVALPVVPGVPTAVEYLPDVAPPAGSIVIGGVVGQIGNYLHMRFRLSNGQDKDVFIDYDKIHELKPGQGIAISKDHTVSIKLGPDSHLKLDDRGLYVDLEGGNSLIAPDGGLKQSPTGQLMVDCEQMGGCIEQWVGQLISAGAGLKLVNGAMSVDFSTLPADKKKLITPYLIQQGGGLGVDEGGTIFVDFDSMPTDKFENLVKQIHVPIWLTNTLYVWVDKATGSDVLDDGRGSEAKPFNSISAAVQYLTSNYNVDKFYGVIMVRGGTYYESVYLGNYQSTSGMCSLRCADMSSPPQIIVTNDLYPGGFSPETLYVLPRCSWEILGLNVVRNYNFSAVNTNPAWNWAQALTVAENANVNCGACDFTVNVTGVIPSSALWFEFRTVNIVSSKIAFNPYREWPRAHGFHMNIAALSSFANPDSLGVHILASYDSGLGILWGTLDPAIPAICTQVNMSGNCRDSILCENGGSMLISGNGYTNSVTFTGTVTGKKYYVGPQSYLSLGGRSPSALPGSEAGTVDSEHGGIVA